MIASARLARERHPDRFQGAERQKAEIDFQEITEAFNVLLDPDRRRQHDLELARPEASVGGSDASRLGRFHMEAGVQFYRDGNLVQAAEAFESAIQAEPKNHQAWHHLAQALCAAAAPPGASRRGDRARLRAAGDQPLLPQARRQAPCRGGIGGSGRALLQ